MSIAFLPIGLSSPTKGLSFQIVLLTEEMIFCFSMRGFEKTHDAAPPSSYGAQFVPNLLKLKTKWPTDLLVSH
jgi:hypothetical protein